MASYKKIGDRLTIYKFNDIEFVLLNSRQIVPPPGAIPSLPKNLHSVHVGVDRTMSLFFWHGMLNDITNTINSCKACQLYVPSQKKKAITSRPLKEAAFSFKECAADLFSLHGNDYIVLVDRLTSFLCCKKLSKTSIASVLLKLTPWFNLLWWPEIVQTDGGPQFHSEFDDFCKNFSIHPELSSPYHPESNGLAEGAIKNAKT